MKHGFLKLTAPKNGVAQPKTKEIRRAEYPPMLRELAGVPA